MLSARSAGPYIPDMPIAPSPTSDVAGPAAPSRPVPPGPPRGAAPARGGGGPGAPGRAAPRAALRPGGGRWAPVQPPQPLERPPQDARDLHLRDAEERRDLCLCQVLLEAQAKRG